MCPNTELLSAYYDHELDEVWGERIAQHVCQCAKCRAKLSRFSRLTDELERIDVREREGTFALEASMLRSWHAIQAARGVRVVAFWRRRISIPIPVLAAAAAVFVAVFGLGVYFNFTGGSSSSQYSQPVAIQQTEIAPVDFQVNNLNDLLNYLNSKDLGTSVVIQLPKGVDQLAVGKPQLIRAADFNRGQ